VRHRDASESSTKHTTMRGGCLRRTPSDAKVLMPRNTSPTGTVTFAVVNGCSNTQRWPMTVRSRGTVLAPRAGSRSSCARAMRELTSPSYRERATGGRAPTRRETNDRDVIMRGCFSLPYCVARSRICKAHRSVAASKRLPGSTIAPLSSCSVKSRSISRSMPSRCGAPPIASALVAQRKENQLQRVRVLPADHEVRVPCGRPKSLAPGNLNSPTNTK
jgi:hypothetical protein